MTESLSDLSVRFINALLDSADVGVIGVSNWWPRATTALESAAAGAENAAHAASIAARKLQIDVIKPADGKTLTEIAPLIDGSFAEWQEVVARECPYIIALAYQWREERKVAAKKSKEGAAA